ncbi:MAG: multiple sugar transport system substrate-binding protein [Chloroflexota bacterium]|jgi:multiple sugar transport system substrate-binding protein|nr:multiple sugar transport system substrate-binding protein [Chloroflexota bacterium]
MVHRARPIAALVGLILVLAACAGGAQQSASGAAAQPDHLVIAAVQGNESEGIKALADDYEAETGIALQIEELPYPQLYEKLVTTFEANDSSYDLVMLDDPWMPKFGTEDWLQPLDSTYGFERDDDIAGVIYDVGTWPPPRGPVPPSEREKDQHLLGITVVGNVEMFMFRSDLMDAPATWDDVLAAAEENDADALAGYAIRGAATNPIVADFLPILWSFGGDVFDENWEVVFNSPDSLAAVKFLVEDLKAVGEASPESIDAADRSRLMAIGEALQSTVWPGEVNSVVLGEGTTVEGNVEFIPMPAGPSGEGFGMMGNWLLGIPTAAENGQAAADFIQWMTEQGTQELYAENGGIPSRTSVLNDETLNEANPYFSALAESLAAGPNWRPRTDQWNAVETVLGTNLNAALAGQMTAEEAVDAASEEIHQIMEEAGYYQ